MGILTNDLVQEAQKYLNTEKEIRNSEIVKEILLVFPNSKIKYWKKELKNE